MKSFLAFLFCPMKPTMGRTPHPSVRGGAKQRLQRSTEDRTISPPVKAKAKPIPKTMHPRQRAQMSRSEPSSSAAGMMPDTIGDDFKEHVAKLFLMNKFSGKETVDLVQKALRAQAKGLTSLARAGGHGTAVQNACRDLTRALLQNSDMPFCIGPRYQPGI